MEIYTLAHKCIRKTLALPRKLHCTFAPPPHTHDRELLQGQDAQDAIYKNLSQDAPCMIARFGSVELQAISRCIASREKAFLKKIKNYVTNKSEYFAVENFIYTELQNNAGFFPANKLTLQKFTDIYLESVPNIDILGSWLFQENYIQTFSPHLIKCALGSLEPYGSDLPWSRILEGKKVLIIHPFLKSIREQYKKREHLFENALVLPEFELKTIKAVQSIAGSKTNFDSWFSALDFMKDEIAKKDFDIALIGAGAYGMPLASFVKSLGKKSVHLGGALQILFGIRGKRWDAMSNFQKFFNEHWVYPLPEETPKNSLNVEGGCYW